MSDYVGYFFFYLNRHGAQWQHSEYSCQIVWWMRPNYLFVTWRMGRQCNHINWRLNCSNGRELIRLTMMMVAAAVVSVRWGGRTRDVEATEAQTSRLTSLAPTRCCYNCSFDCSSVRRYLRIFHVIFEHCNERHNQLTHSATKNKCKVEKKGKQISRKSSWTQRYICIPLLWCFQLKYFSLSLFFYDGVCTTYTHTVNYKTQSIVVSARSGYCVPINSELRVLFRRRHRRCCCCC